MFLKTWYLRLVISLLPGLTWFFLIGYPRYINNQKVKSEFEKSGALQPVVALALTDIGIARIEDYQPPAEGAADSLSSNLIWTLIKPADLMRNNFLDSVTQARSADLSKFSEMERVHMDSVLNEQEEASSVQHQQSQNNIFTPEVISDIARIEKYYPQIKPLMAEHFYVPAGLSAVLFIVLTLLNILIFKNKK